MDEYWESAAEAALAEVGLEVDGADLRAMAGVLARAAEAAGDYAPPVDHTPRPDPEVRRLRRQLAEAERILDALGQRYGVTYDIDGASVVAIPLGGASLDCPAEVI